MKISKVAFLVSLTLAAMSAQAAESIDHSGQASKHSVLAVAHGAASTAKVVSAVVAVPLIVAGGVSVVAGSASVAAGTSVLNSKASTGILIITDKTVTVDPAPNKAMNH